MNLSVIIRTHGPESWLDKTLTGFALQARRDFEVIVADEGGPGPAAELVAGRRQGYPVPLRHLRPDDGGGGALAAAIRQSAHGYVLLTNADCIPCRDFVAVHAGLAGRGRFLCGECCRLDGDLGRRISRNDIVRGYCFEPDWLQAHGRMAATDRRRLGGGSMAARLLEAITPAAAAFNACNASAWKDDLLAACDDAAADDDSAGDGLGRRLGAMGVRGRRISGQAVCLHLGHEPDRFGQPRSPGRPAVPAGPLHAGRGPSARQAATTSPTGISATRA